MEYSRLLKISFRNYKYLQVFINMDKDNSFNAVQIQSNLVLPSIDTRRNTSTKPPLPSGSIGVTVQSLPLLPPTKNLVFSDGEKWIPIQTQYGGGGSGSEPIFQMNDSTQATQNPGTNIVNIFGDDTDSPAPFTQRRSGILTTSLNSNTIQIQNQRDISSYIVGDPNVYNVQFSTIQAAIDQAIADGVNSSASPKREAVIIVRPGTYPGNVSITRKGIHLVTLSSGSSRSVIISGSFTYSPQDNAGGAETYIQGICFTGGVNISVPNLSAFPSILFDMCLMEGGLTTLSTNGTIRLVLIETTVLSTFNATGMALILFLQSNSYIEDLALDLFTIATIIARTSTLSIRQLRICDSIIIRAKNCVITFLLSVAGVTSYFSQRIELNIANCEFSGPCAAYGSFSATGSIDSCIVNSLEIGDPSPSNTDNYYSYCVLDGFSPNIYPQKPFLVNNCIVRDFLKITMKADTPDVPQSVQISNCTFHRNVSLSTAPLQINDLSSVTQSTSRQMVIIKGCTLNGCISLNLDDSGNAIAGVVGANLYTKIYRNDINIENTTYPVFPSTCIVGGSFGGLSPVQVNYLLNVFTLIDLTNFMFNGLGDGIIAISTQTSTGDPLGNVITNTGATAVQQATGNVSLLTNGSWM